MSYADNMTFEVILSNLLNNVPDTIDKREGSIIYDALAPAAAELAKAYIELDVIMDETFVDSASFQGLTKRCQERGVPIQEASAAVIEGAFTPATLQLTEGVMFNCDDQNFAIKEKVSDGIYKLEAETPGTGGNVHSGILLPIQYVDGLQTAEITGLLIPGEEGDSAETLRARYFNSLDSQAFGGNKADYKEKVNLVDGVGGVKVYPVWNGGGTVKLTIIASDYTIPSQALINAVQTSVDPEQNQGEGVGIAPIGHVVTVDGVGGFTVNIITTLTFIDGWVWEDAKEAVKGAVNEYFHELATTWADDAATIVRISQIENKILNLPIVLDVANTTLNGNAQNIQLGADQIPVLGTIGVTP